MHALVIGVEVESGHEGEGIEYLHANVLPAMKQTPGLVSGYWLSAKDGQGLTVLLFEDQKPAQDAAAGLASAPKADFATVGTVEVREVVAHL